MRRETPVDFKGWYVLPTHSGPIRTYYADLSYFSLNRARKMKRGQTYYVQRVSDGLSKKRGLGELYSFTFGEIKTIKSRPPALAMTHYDIIDDKGRVVPIRFLDDILYIVDKWMPGYKPKIGTKTVPKMDRRIRRQRVKSTRKPSRRYRHTSRSSRKSRRRSSRKPRRRPSRKPLQKSRRHPKPKSQCQPSMLKKYLSRPSPPYPAQHCPNKVKQGNDGRRYRSVADKRGIYRWQLA